MSKNWEIRRDEYCLDYAGGVSSLGERGKIVTYPCHNQGGNQKWTIDNGLIRHKSGYCIEISSDKAGIYMEKCDPSNPRQIWKWKKREST